MPFALAAENAAWRESKLYVPSASSIRCHRAPERTVRMPNCASRAKSFEVNLSCSVALSKSNLVPSRRLCVEHSNPACTKLRNNERNADALSLPRFSTHNATLQSKNGDTEWDPSQTSLSSLLGGRRIERIALNQPRRECRCQQEDLVTCVFLFALRICSAKMISNRKYFE